jgi:uncharacterized protein (TIGR02145 family)
METTYRTTVTVPAGVPVSPGQLTVRTSVHSAQVGNDGAVAVNGFEFGPQLALVSDLNGNPLLLGWLGQGTAPISARTTAEVLAFFALGAPLHPSPVPSRVRELLKSEPAIDTVAGAVAASLSASVSAFTRSNDAVSEALGAALARLGWGEASDHDADPGPLPVVVEPDQAQSGVRLEQRNINEIFLRNAYRRRGWAWVDRISVTSGESTEPAYQPLDSFWVPPVTGVGSVLSALTDYVAGEVAYGEVETPSLFLPGVEDADHTTYRVIQAGLGLHEGVLDELSFSRQQSVERALVDCFMLDIFLPFVLPVILGEFDAEGFFDNALASSAYQDVVDVVLDQTMMNHLMKGEVRQAWDWYWVKFREREDLRDAVIQKLLILAEDLWGIETAANAGEMMDCVLKLLGYVDTILATFDKSLIGIQLAQSNLADAWTVKVLPPKITLSPDSAALGRGEGVKFTATVQDAPTGQDFVRYQWYCSRANGYLVDGLGRQQDSAYFSSTLNTVTYRVDTLASGSADIIMVKPYTVAAGSTDTIWYGTRRAQVSIIPFQVFLTPDSVLLAPNDSVEFQVSVVGLGDTPEDTVYAWLNTHTVGDLRDGSPGNLNQFSSSSPRAQYVARGDTSGYDILSVLVRRGEEGAWRAIGEAQAKVVVQPFRVRLSPASAVVETNESVEFDVWVEGAGEAPADLWYKWVNTGVVGDLTDGVPGHVNQFESSNPRVRYTARPDTAGTDVILVTVWRGEEGSREYVGDAMAPVTVMDRLVIRLWAAPQTVAPQATAVIQALLEGSTGGEPVQYRWETAGTYGTLTDGATGHLNQFTSTSNRVEYQGGESQGSEWIKVQALLGPPGQATPRAADSILIRVDAWTGTVADIDGNVYRTVGIGGQEWMAENLRTTRFVDGRTIEHLLTVEQWTDSTVVDSTIGGWAHYGNNASNDATYGKLYNWYAVDDPGGLCPTGWRVPSDADWSVLLNHLGGSGAAGGKLKSSRTEPAPHPRWNSPNAGATNETGFSATPGGLRVHDGQFGFFGTNGQWWSSTSQHWYVAYSFQMSHTSGVVGRGPSSKPTGMSVRCVR